MKKLALLSLFLTITACSYSEGQRVGQVVKLSKKGLIFKTYEGELATMASGTSATMIANTFKFSVKNKELAEKIQASMDAGKQVSLTYEQEFIVFPWEGETDYYITDVK
jgi:hypothetical protein